MTQYLIPFRSLIHAQRAARLLERSGTTATVIKAPQGLSSSGCAYAVTLRKQPEAALELLRRNQMKIGKVFARDLEGNYREVKL